MGRAVGGRALRRRPGPGEALSLVSSDTYRVAGVSWSVVQQASTVTAILTASTALLVISVPLGLGVIAGTVVVLVVMRRVSMPLEARGLAEQGSAARAGEVATDMITGIRVVIGMNARPEAARRYRAASEESRRGAVAASRSVLAYGNISLLLSGVFLAFLSTASAHLALAGSITVGQLVTVLGLAQFLQGSLAHVGTFASNWMHKRASARRLGDLLDEPPLIAPAARPATGAAAAAHALRWCPPEHGEPLDLRPGELLGVVPRHPGHARELSDRLGYRVPLPRGELLVDGVDAVDLGPDPVRARIVAPPTTVRCSPAPCAPTSCPTGATATRPCSEPRCSTTYSNWSGATWPRSASAAAGSPADSASVCCSRVRCTPTPTSSSSTNPPPRSTR